MLWHFRLGQPNFQYMKHLFTHVFYKIDVSTLSCDVCIQAKQHWGIFFLPNHTNQSTISLLFIMMFEVLPRSLHLENSGL